MPYNKLGIFAQTGNNIVTEGLILHFDPSFNKSYPGLDSSGAGIFNLASGSLTPTGSFADDAAVSGNGESKYMTFDGTDDNVGIPNAWNGVKSQDMSWIDPCVTANAISLNVWMYPRNVTDTEGIVGAYDWAASRGMFELRKYADDLWFFIMEGTADSRHIALNVLTADEWINVVGTYDGSTIRIYVNGVENGSGTSSTKSVTTIDERMWIGASGDSTGTTNNFDGDIGPVMIYDKTLTQAEITQNYNASKDRYSN